MTELGIGQEFGLFSVSDISGFLTILLNETLRIVEDFIEINQCQRKTCG